MSEFGFAQTYQKVRFGANLNLVRIVSAKPGPVGTVPGPVGRAAVPDTHRAPAATARIANDSDPSLFVHFVSPYLHSSAAAAASLPSSLVVIQKDR